MRLPPPPIPFSVLRRITNTNRLSIHSRLFASNAASGLAPPSHRPTYIVPRNSRGTLPVYSDIRNGGTRYLISVRNVEGNIKALADDLLRDLSDPESPKSTLIKVRITGSNHLVLSGLRRKQTVLDWLARHGF